MNVETQFTQDNKVLTISINGDFNFLLLNEFRKAYNNDEADKAEKIVVDMRKTETIDSSALGMLLNMQRHLKKSNGEISIVNCNSVVEKIFNITHFEKKFSIE